MEGGSLFNPGFLGSHFYWWIGQIADDSTWRDNIVPGKFESKDQVPGWGRRYKVRIIGLHDKEETTIPSDQLPWAQVMYPITAGGGQAAASATPNLRQGNFVFGFFLDGQDQQVPVIMGVLGNNAQTALSTQIGTDKSNFSATSGFATPVNGDKDLNIKVPKESLVTVKPKSVEQSSECSPPPNGVSVNQFGLRSDLPLSKAQFQDQQRAILEADSRISSGLLRQEDRASFIQSEVAKGIKNRCEEANSPGSPSQPGATREQPDNPHELSAADVIRNEKMLRKVPLSSPCKKQKTDLKNIQIVIENLTKDINKVQQAANSYIDAVSTIYPANRIGCRIGPTSAFNDIKDSDPQALFGYVAEQLGRKGLGYIHVIEGQTGGDRNNLPFNYDTIYQKFKMHGGGASMANNGYNKHLAEATSVDLVAFGVPFISNPDLVYRLEHDLPLAQADSTSFYGGGEKGYTDYLLYPKN